MSTRRDVISTISVVVASAISGCSSRDEKQNPETGVSETESARTDSDTPTETLITETNSVQKETKDLLPDPTEEWTQLSEPEFVVVGNGTYEGHRASYSTSDDRRYDAVVLKRGDVPNTPELQTLGERLACVGWQTVVVTTERVYAASSGTTTQTQTPEAPPLMETTPVDDREQRSAELLALSPGLTDEKVRQNTVECAE